MYNNGGKSMLPVVMEENKEILNEALSRGYITQRLYGENVVSTLRITDFSFDDRETAHIRLNVYYTKSSALATNREDQNTMTLLVFNSAKTLENGEKGWRETFKNRLFNGNPPFTVAIDVFRHNVYLVYLDENGIILSLFTTLGEEDTNMIIKETSLNKPYELQVPSEVLMDMISGDEGYNHAYRHLQIVFNCSVPLAFSSGLIMQ